MKSKKWATKDDFRLLGGVLFGTKLAAQFPGRDAAPTHTYCIHIYKRWRNKYALIISPTVFFFYSTSIHAHIHTCTHMYICIYICVWTKLHIMKITYFFIYLFQEIPVLYKSLIFISIMSMSIYVYGSIYIYYFSIYLYLFISIMSIYINSSISSTKSH